MTEKFIINQNGEIEDTITHITFDSFTELLIVLNGQSRQLKKLSEENELLKGEVKRLQCINKQLEERLDKDIALNMDCGEVE